MKTSGPDLAAIPAAASANNRKSFFANLWSYKMPLLFVLPSLVLIAMFMIVPLIRSFTMSFYQWDGILAPEFIGFRNFTQLFQDDYFWKALGNNLMFTVLTTGLTVVLGFLFAVAIERRLRGWNIFKISYFLPVMISMTVVGMLMGRILEPNYGLLNGLLDLLGLGFMKAAWLGDPHLALYSVIGVTVWQYTGFVMLLLLAAVEGISPEIHDAATIDGVTGWQRITRIMLPLVKRVLMVVIMLQIIFSFKVFDIVWVMTQGGPGNASEVLGTYLYKSAFTSQKFGYASAIAVMMTLIVFVFSIIYLRLSDLGEQNTE